MKTPNDFYFECLEGFVEVSKGFGYALGGARGNEVLMKRAEQSVRELLKYKPLIELHGKNPPMYYYYISGLAFAMGVVLAMLQANAPEKFKERDLIPMIVNDPETSAHDLAFHTLQQFGLHPEIYNQLVQELYKKFQALHEPYWTAKEPRDYTLAAFYASFMTGASIAIGKFEEKRAQRKAVSFVMRAATFGAVLTAMLAVSAKASTLDASLIQTTGEPSVAAGMFYGYRTADEGPGNAAFTKAKALAASEDVPLVVIWSHESCHFCDNFIADLNAQKSAVASWLAANRAVFTFFKATGYDGLPSPDNAVAGPGYTEPKACLDAWQFVTGTCRSQHVWPLIGFYYRKPDGKSVVWGHGYRENKDFAYLRDSFAAWCEENGINEPHGGAFSSAGTEFDRYEAETNTVFVDVTLVRDEVDAAFAWGNRLEAVWPDGLGETVVTNIAWSAGQDKAVVRVPLLPKPDAAFPVGARIELRLYDSANGALTGSNAIHCVELENAAANPKWIGEDFGFGEWTMDLDAAKAKVAAANGEAFTVVSLQGSKWCPDCANVDRNFLDLTNAAGENAFCAWAKAKQVALVTIDIPNFKGPKATDYASPSLLDRTPFVTTLARATEYPQSGADASLLQPLVRSGLGYLSRKSVDEETAAFYFNRNHDLASKNTSEGGFHRPEDGNKNRTGVPIFVLLRKDGSVAARLTRMASVSPMAADRGNFANYIRRFEEMMAIAADGDGHADATEIENNHPSGTPCTVASAGGDVTNELCNADFQDAFEIVGDLRGMRQTVRITGTDDAVVNVALMSRGDSGLLETLASTNAALSAAPALTCDFRKTGRYFVQVKGADITSPAFDLASAEDLHFHSYRLTTSAEPIPPVPGTVAFAASNRRIIEYAGTGVVRVVRTGGSFGVSRVKVVCDNPPEDDRFVWKDTVLAWDDGEDGEREVRIPIVPNKTVNPEVSFTLRLEADGPCAAAVSTNVCEVTVFDTDLPCLGSTSYALAPDRFFETAIPFEVYNVSNAASLAVSVKKGSGTVPPGLRFVVDKTTGAISLVGVPSTAGTWSFTVTLTEKRKNKSVSGIETQITLTVADRSMDNPYLALARPNVRLPLSDGGIVAGMLSFAVTSRGGISARYAGTEGKAISFAGNWQVFDPILKAVSAVLKTGDATLTVAMNEDGRAELALDPGDGSSFAAESSWPVPGEPFTGYQGRYNVTFPYAGGVLPVTEPCGTGFLQLDLTAESAVAAGLVRYAGQLPDGTPVSGSEYLLRDGLLPDVAQLPIFRRVSDSCFSAALEIGVNGAAKWDGNGYDERRGILSREIVNSVEGMRVSYLHRDSAWEYRTFHEACGSYYVPGVSPKALCDKFHSGRTAFALTLSSGMAAPVAPHGQVSTVTSKADADVGMETIELVPEIDGLSFSYDSRLGVFCGEALLTFADGRTAVGSYRGTAIPGWTNCGCGLENPPIRPFASGTLKFRDWVDGHAVVRSFPVDLDADVTRVTLASAASPASSGGTAGSAVGTVSFAGETQTEEDGYGVDFSFLSNRIVGDCLTADDQAIIGQYDAATKLGVTSVGGLPTGMKLVKTTVDGVTTYSVEGTFTKAGTFTAKVSVACEDPGTGKIVRTTVQRKLTVDAADAIQLTASVRDAESAPKCRVSGGGLCKPGSTVRFSATAASKFAFAGWFDANGLPLAAGGADYRASSVSETVGALTVRDRYAAFVPSADDGLAIDGLDGAEYALDPNGGKVFREVFDVASGSLPTLTFKGLPTGVTCAPSGDFPSEYALVYDPATVRTAPKPGRYRVTATAKNATLKTAAAVTADFLITVSNLVSEAIAVVDDYGVLTPDIEMTPISLSEAVDFTAGWTLSVSGLPTGLKYNAKGYERMISGTPTKPGEYTLTFTAKKGRTTETATAFITVKPRPEITAVVDAVAQTAGCKVTGTGNYKCGTTVTLRATAPKGWVFAGWTNADVSGLAALNPSLAVTTGGEDLEIIARFIPVSEDHLKVAEPDGVVILDLNQDIATWSDGVLTGTDLILGLVDTLSWPTVTLRDLPTGLKFDAKTLKLSGKANKSGFYYATVSAKNAGGYAHSQIVRFAVKDAAGNVPEEPVCVNEANVDFSPLGALCTGLRTDGETHLAIPAPVISDVSCNVTKVAVTGLPKGLSAEVRINEVGGSADVFVGGLPTTPGRTKLSLKVTAADPENSNSTKTLTSECWLTVRDGGSIWLSVKNDSPDGGTVTGEGVYAMSALAKLTAKPAKDFVFSGWWVNEAGPEPIPLSGADHRSLSVSLPVDDFYKHVMTIVGTFVPAVADTTVAIRTDADFWRIDPEENGAFGYAVDSLSLPKVTVMGLPRGVSSVLTAVGGQLKYRTADKAKLVPGRYAVTIGAVNQSKANAVQKTVSVLVPVLQNDFFLEAGLDQGDAGYSVQAGMDATEALASLVEMANGLSARGLKVAFANLPKGLKISEQTTVNGKEFVVSGVPSAAGFYAVTVSATGTDSKTGGKVSESAKFFMNVAALPTGLVGTFNGFVYREKSPCGTVVITSKPTGEISAKVMRPTGTFSLTAKSWDSLFEFEGRNYGECMLVGTRDDLFLAVTVCFDSPYQEMQVTGAYQESASLPEFSFEAQRDSFADNEAAASVAAALEGTYRFSQLAAGGGLWTLKLAKSAQTQALTVKVSGKGVAKFAGALVEETVRTTVNGSATLLLTGENKATAQLVAKKDAESVLVVTLDFEKTVGGEWVVSNIEESTPGCRAEIYRSEPE